MIFVMKENGCIFLYLTLTFFKFFVCVRPGLLKLLEGSVVNDDNSDKIGRDFQKSRFQVSGAFFTRKVRYNAVSCRGGAGFLYHHTHYKQATSISSRARKKRKPFLLLFARRKLYKRPPSFLFLFLLYLFKTVIERYVDRLFY